MAGSKDYSDRARGAAQHSRRGCLLEPGPLEWRHSKARAGEAAPIAEDNWHDGRQLRDPAGGSDENSNQVATAVKGPKGNKTARTTPVLAERTQKRQPEKPVLYLLALIAALLAGCGPAGKPGTFSSQNYGYNAALPAGWSGHQAENQWSGGGSPGFEDNDVDLFSGPNGITVMAYGAASSQSLTAYTKANVQAAAVFHSCPAIPASDQAITVGGAPAQLLSTQCEGLSIETAITIHAGKAFVFVSQLPSGTRADRSAFRKFLASIRLRP